MTEFEGSVCRVCLFEKGTVLLNNVMEDMFHYCTMLKTSKCDRLPQNLCDKCARHLRIAYDFRLQAIYADQSLRKMLEEPKPRSTSKETTNGFSQETPKRFAPMKEPDVAPYLKSEAGDPPAKHYKVLTENSPHDETVGLLSDHLSDDCEKTDGTKDNLDDASNISDQLSNHKQKQPVSEFQRDLESMLLHNGKIECNICGAASSSIYTLKAHFITHSGHRPFHCTICNKRFVRHSILKNHLRIHTGNLKYVCDICGATYASKISLTRHRIRDHDRNRNSCNKFTCTLCHVEHVSKYALNGHMRLHLKQMNEESLKPQPALSKGEGEMGLYQKIPVDELPRFGCMAHDCNQTFERKYQLLMHLQGHADAHHLIQLCLADPSVEYLEETRMKRAPLSHNVNNSIGKTPAHICGCKRKFSRKWALSLHRQMHGGHQPLKCPLCSHHSQATIADLRTHMRLVHDNNRQELAAVNCTCALCGYRFYSLNGYVHHLGRHERIE